MKGTLGGIRDPSVPPTATEDVASRGPYPAFSISGVQIRPIAAAQATLEPVIAENPPQPRMDAMASPPGSLANQTRAAL